jgi:phage baseplate assembly protein W|tara:strand:+ start:2244 stop:2645 length:402 start_codon:yes stop_codon:yes gene_type:complete
MASGIAPRLPLVFDNVFGPYGLITDFETLAKQNLKMLVLTNPGERMMDTQFGVGLRKYLFEQNAGSTYSDIQTRIRNQVQRYLPFIGIKRIDFSVPEGNPDLFPNNLVVSIFFTIIPLQTNAILNVEVNNNIN